MDELNLSGSEVVVVKPVIMKLAGSVENARVSLWIRDTSSGQK